MLKNTSKKLILIVILVFALIGTATGVTVAYIVDRTPSVENNFDPVYVSCDVEEEFDGIVKSDVKVRNTGDINAYVRATFVAMWINSEGKVFGAAPVLDVDYTLTLDETKWQKGNDGFYYYTSKLPSGSATDILIEEITLIGAAPEGYFLTVHVAATAIQAEPENVVADTWGVTVKPNGTIVAPQ
jgi:hypothetical protein